MTGKIFKSIVAVATAVLLSSLVIITGVLYSYFGRIQRKELQEELHLAAAALSQLGEPYLQALDTENFRLTWVDADGNVRLDTWADAAAMENHKDREEIRDALRWGAGSSIRHSATLTEKTIYEATRLPDGSVLRISVSRATALTLVLGMLHPLVLIGILAVALSAWLARRMAKRIVEPLNNLDLNAPMENDAYEELSPLLHRIYAQHLEIQEQLRTLQHKQEEFNQITDNMKEALVLLDSMERIVSINPAARALFGAGIRSVGADFLTIHRKQDMRCAVQEAKEQGHASFRGTQNAREYQFDLSRIDSGEAVQGLVILAFDITEQVNAERNRQEFTANVSHELKTPLQSIIGSAELMENGIVRPEDMPRFVGRIRKEASRLVCLIEDILRLSQLDEGLEMPRETLSLRAISQEVCETLADAAREKAIALTVTGGEGFVTGVRRLLTETVYNLCDNAIKYSNPGGSVEISIAEEGEHVRLSVRDGGIGIAPEHQEKVFERFYRVDKSHSKQSGGTGLGLSIVKHAVQYHQGIITMDSQLGKGTTITITLNKPDP